MAEHSSEQAVSQQPAPFLIHPGFFESRRIDSSDPQGGAYLWWLGLHNRADQGQYKVLEDLTHPAGELTDFEAVAAEYGRCNLQLGGPGLGPAGDETTCYIGMIDPGHRQNQHLLVMVRQDDRGWQATRIDPWPQQYLSVSQAADFLGISRVAFNKRSPQPIPDAWIGNTRGFSASTLLTWQRDHPSRRRPRNQERPPAENPNTDATA